MNTKLWIICLTSNCDNICRIYVFNGSLEIFKSSDNYQKGNSYSSLIKAISEINKCDTTKNETIFELLTDFVILGSYEIDLYKTNNESLD